MEQNKLIAEFMGDNFHERSTTSICSKQVKYVPHLSELKYHTSWDWLMPVVEKIEHIDSVTHGNRFQVVIYEEEVEIYDKHTQKPVVCIPVDGESKLTNTYKAVVEFIKQYNK